MQPFTILLVIAVVAVSSVLASHHHEDNGPAYYKFEYGVNDHHTGDKKSQYEHADGKHVNGGYQLKEADGTLRVVKYYSDPHGGFQAQVQRIGHAQHPAHYGHGGHGGHGGDGGHGGNGGGHGGSSYVGVTHYGYNKH